jgi:hypothetical protein
MKSAHYYGLLRYSIYVVSILCFTTISCISSKTNSSTTSNLEAAALQPYGRFIINQERNLELISSAVHFGFSFEGEECQVFASLPNKNDHNYLQYELDGKYQKRIRIQGASSDPFVLKVQGGGRHTMWIYKATEAHTGPIYIKKITGSKISPLKRQDAPLIEFIGNSITCGAAADASEVACGTGVYHDQHNAYHAYGPTVARAIGANFILSSVSGIGIYRNWNSDPQVVSIALGTNDFSNGDGINKRLPFDSASFVRSYITFVQQVKLKYPNALIALLSSPMVRGSARETLQNCLIKVKEDVDALYPTAKPVSLYFFNPMEPHGCTGHPNLEDHALLAKELELFFRKILQ